MTSVQNVGGALATEVPISDYRANLKAWHERVAEGEDLVVTEHGKPVVRVTLPTGEAYLRDLERRGLLTRPTKKSKAADLPKFRSERRSEEVIAEMRGE